MLKDIEAIIFDVDGTLIDSMWIWTDIDELFLEKYNLEKNSYILFVARIVPEKGLHYLLEAWKLVREQIATDKKLVVAGFASHSDEY